jgi:DUF971 family protein
LSACWFKRVELKRRIETLRQGKSRLTHSLTLEYETMAGLNKDSPTPQALTLHTQSRVLEIGFSNGESFRIPYELMRVYSPSAEVQGHGAGQETLQTGKRMVGIVKLEPVGNYAVQPTFSDGHDSGIFSWDYLYFLGSTQTQLWADYERRLQAAGSTRDTPMPEKKGQQCGTL